MSERVEQQLLELLEHPREDPYGNTIPGPAEIGQPVAGVAELPGTSLSASITADPAHYTLVRIGEPLQVDVELLSEFERVGLVPGVGFRAQTDGAAADLTVNGQRLELTEDTVGHLFVGASDPA